MTFGDYDILDISSLMKATASLKRALEVIHRQDDSEDSDKMEVLRAGAIQYFEFTYELCWKFMKRWIEMNVNRDIVSGVPRIELYRVAAENGLITDVLKWMEFHKARNLTSHMYNESVALEVYEKAAEFLPYAIDFYRRLEERL